MFDKYEKATVIARRIAKSKLSVLRTLAEKSMELNKFSKCDTKNV